MKTRLLLAVALYSTVSAFAQPTPTAPKPALPNILFEGSFPEVTGGTPTTWNETGFAGGTHGNFVKSTADRDGNYVSLFIKSLATSTFNLTLREPIQLIPTWRTLAISYDIRVFNFIQGSENHHKPRLNITFFDQAGAELSHTGVSLPGKPAETWQTAEKRVSIPTGAVEAQIWIGTFSSQGQLDYRQVTVIPSE